MLLRRIVETESVVLFKTEVAPQVVAERSDDTEARKIGNAPFQYGSV